MINSTLRYRLVSNSLDILKEAASNQLREIPPARRIEAVSRAIGYKSYAALRVANRQDLTVNVEATDVAAALKLENFEVEPLLFHLTMANYSARIAISEYSELNINGMAVVVPRDRTAEIPFSQRSAARQELYLQKKKEDQTALLRADSEVLRAMALCSNIIPIGKRSNYMGSYRLKHTAENLSYKLDDGVILQKSYVSNGAMLAAAIAAGFRLYRPEFDSLNAWFNTNGIIR